MIVCVHCQAVWIGKMASSETPILVTSRQIVSQQVLWEATCLISCPVYRLLCFCSFWRWSIGSCSRGKMPWDLCCNLCLWTSSEFASVNAMVHDPFLSERQSLISRQHDVLWQMPFGVFTCSWSVDAHCSCMYHMAISLCQHMSNHSCSCITGNLTSRLTSMQSWWQHTCIALTCLPCSLAGIHRAIESLSSHLWIYAHWFGNSKLQSLHVASEGLWLTKFHYTIFTAALLCILCSSMHLVTMLLPETTVLQDLSQPTEAFNTTNTMHWDVPLRLWSMQSGIILGFSLNWRQKVLFFPFFLFFSNFI